MFRVARTNELPAGRMGAAKWWSAPLLLALSVSALLLCAKPSRAANVPAHPDLNLMIWQEQFDELENLANEFRKEKTGFYSGWPKLGLLYERLNSLDGNVTDAVWQEYIAKIEKWQKAFPESPTPRVVLGDTYVKWAWKARGGGYADTVTEDGWRLMRERLVKARAILEDSEKLPVRDAELYRVLMKVALGQGWTKEELDAAFQKGIALDPNYQRLYEAKAYFLLPRWHGQKGEWEAFVAEAADARGGDDGDILYMSVARSLAWTEKEEFFKNTNISYERMKRGFEASLRRYPTYFWDMNSYCYFACIAGDSETAKQLFDRIKDRWEGGVWSRQDFDRWKAWANPPAQEAPRSVPPQGDKAQPAG